MKNTLIVGSLIIAAFLAGNAISNTVNKSKEPQIQGVSQQISSLSPQQFSDSLNSGDYVLLDIRTQEEYNAGHIKNAKQNDYYQTKSFSDYLDTLDKKSKYLIYCRTGKRSSAALQIMKNKGFENVNDLAGGYSAWVAAKLPTE